MSKKNKKLKKFKNKTGENINDVKHNEDYIKDTSPYVYQKNKLKTPLNIRIRPDLTDNQKKFLDLALDKNVKIMFVSGPAGTSKSFCSIMAGLKLLNDKKVSDILYLRSVVESSENKMGYLPGDENSKLSPYLHVLVDKLDELLSRNETDMLIKEQRIQGHPINFIRGASWNSKMIIIDEIQNLTANEIFTGLTRIGQFSKMILCGDESQSDIGNKSGFTKMMNIFNDEESRQNGIVCFKFDETDIVRSEIVKFIVKKVKK
jgi:phosphate starvation-inducible protein PhoH and related proteins